MAIDSTFYLENNDIFFSAVDGLYSRHNIQKQQKRYANLFKSHLKNFDVSSADFYSSPGRIELLGNHTDHNNGKVLAAAISLDTLACVTKTDSNCIKILSGGYPMLTVRLDQLDACDEERGTSVALVKGVCNWFKEHGYNVGGFVATMVSDVMKGAGVSSSASFEVLVAEILNDLYNGGKVTDVEKAVASQYAENRYFGKPCGLLDQSAIALGDVVYIDFKDPASMQVKNYDLPFDDLDIVVINTGGDHSDLTDNYAAIRSEMEFVATCFGKHVLREVDEEEFYRAVMSLNAEKQTGQKLGSEHPILSAVASRTSKCNTQRSILRAMHFFEENHRVDDAVDAIKNNDESKFLQMINESGQSSYDKLQNCYPNEYAQNIPLALAVLKRHPAVKACRVHGGGFAGTVLCFVDKEGSEKFLSGTENFFCGKNIFNLSIRKSGAKKVHFGGSK